MNFNQPFYYGPRNIRFFFATVTRFFIASRITRFTLTRNIDISSDVAFFTITRNYWAIFSFTKLFSLLPLLSRLRHKSFGDKFHFSLQEIKKIVFSHFYSIAIYHVTMENTTVMKWWWQETIVILLMQGCTFMYT